MNNFEFLSYTPTPQEKHLGIATIKIYGKIILRYKIIKTKDGTATFPAAATCKIADQEGERYIPAFILDSTTDNEFLMKFIKENIKRYMNGSNSAFNSLPHAPNNLTNSTHQSYVSTQGMAQGTQNSTNNDNLPF